MSDQISNVETPSTAQTASPAPAPAAAAPAAAPAAQLGISKEDLAKVLTPKQQRALGLLPATHQSEKVKARNEMMRERMKEFHRKKAEDKAKAEATKVAKPASKRSQPNPPAAKEQESQDEESSDDYLQKKSKKIKTVVKTLTHIDERLRRLHEANQHNPYYKILMR